MRTQSEILARIKERDEGDPFDWEIDEYIVFLDWEHVKDFLIPDADQGGWNDDFREPTRENVLEKMREYMPFAVDKAERGRGLSALRSIMHYTAWVWLLEDDDLLEVVMVDYEDYGKGILGQISRRYGWSA